METQERITRRQIFVQSKKKFLTTPEMPLLELPSWPAYEPHKTISCKFILKHSSFARLDELLGLVDFTAKSLWLFQKKIKSVPQSDCHLLQVPGVFPKMAVMITHMPHCGESATQQRNLNEGKSPRQQRRYERMAPSKFWRWSGELWARVHLQLYHPAVTWLDLSKPQFSSLLVGLWESNEEHP